MEKAEALHQALKAYAILDMGVLGCADPLEACNDCIKGGATMVQLRAKELSDEELFTFAMPLQTLCEGHGVPFIINDSVALAKELGCGVHVGQDDTPVEEARALLGKDAIIGASARTPEAALAAAATGADYLGCGAVFGTATKADAKTIGLEGLRVVTEAVDIPVVAIGGITADRIPELEGSGVAGVAASSALFRSRDVQRATWQIRQAVERILVGEEATS